jgi:4-hydroxy-tetrahydrodipicolinate reductase
VSPPVRLLVHGVGRVGRLVLALAKADPELEVAAAVDADGAGDYRELEEVDLAGVDAIVDFSHASAVEALVRSVAAAEGRVRVVTGTSGWEKDEGRVRESVARRGLYFLHGANFAVGTAVFMHLAGVAAEIFERAGGFDAAVLEIHHRHKKDMPSGTARKLAAALAERLASKKRVLYGHAERAIAPEELHVGCLRLGDNKGFHEVYFDAPGEVVRLSQQTRDRGAYASGALLALKWLMARVAPGYYTFEDVMEDKLYGPDRQP